MERPTSKALTSKELLRNMPGAGQEIDSGLFSLLELVTNADTDTDTERC